MCGSGELIDEFRAVCRTRVWRNPAVILKGLPERWRAACGEYITSGVLKWRMAGRYYDLVYFNTSAVAAYVPELTGCATSSLWHIHELEYVLRLNVGQEQINQLFPKATRFISVSQSVTNTLAKQFQVPSEKIDLVHGFVPVPRLTSEDAHYRRDRIRRQLGWPADAFVVGGCGTLGWRKGTDVFLQVARTACAMIPNDQARFLWVGGGTGRDDSLQFAHDVRAFGLTGRCVIVPSTAEVMDYYHAMDAFALTSREDPFSLVLLEAGACGLPSVCFADTGGGPELSQTMPGW